MINIKFRIVMVLGKKEGKRDEEWFFGFLDLILFWGWGGSFLYY